MTNPPTDERRVTESMFYAASRAYKGVSGVEPKPASLRAALEAALSHQGEVVKVSEIRALQAYWCDWNDQSLDEQPDPDEAIVEFANITIVYKYEDLTALISKAEKV